MDANVLVMVCYPEYAKLNVSEESEVSRYESQQERNSTPACMFEA